MLTLRSKQDFESGVLFRISFAWQIRVVCDFGYSAFFVFFVIGVGEGCD